MCLNIKNRRLYTATKDITVYKIIQRFDDGLKTPFQKASVVIGGLYTSPIIIEETRNGTKFINIALHSFTNKKDAISLAIKWSQIVVKCTIPKGSRYKRGKIVLLNPNTNNPYPSIVSDTIHYDEVIADYT